MVNLVAMPVSRGTMEKHQNRHIRQVEHAAKQWDRRASNVANSDNRSMWLERQNNANYRNEYDRIRGELSHNKIPYANRGQLQRRETELHRLFSSGNV